MGETRVDLLQLLEDLRDAYPGTAEETLLTEIVANSLGSGATSIALTTDPAGRTLTIVDDGRGMRRRELARHHDVAASSKVRGDTIGFAGVGIKIALLVSRQVLTEARAGRQHVATSWGLTSRHRARWKGVEPTGLVAERGTAVRLTLDNGLSPLLDPGYVGTMLRRHFEPLLTPALAGFLGTRYPGGVRLVLNGGPLAPEAIEAGERARLRVRSSRPGARRPSVPVAAVAGEGVVESTAVAYRTRGIDAPDGAPYEGSWRSSGGRPASGHASGCTTTAPTRSPTRSCWPCSWARGGRGTPRWRSPARCSRSTARWPAWRRVRSPSWRVCPE
jgi:hypothetical protein